MSFFDDCATLEELVYQAVGAASTCWENMNNTGIFQENRARAIAQEVVDRIREGTVQI